MLYLFIFQLHPLPISSHFVTVSVRTASFSLLTLSYAQREAILTIYLTVKAILQVFPPKVKGNVAVPAAPGVPVMV
jgi:hypothetical protein